LHRLSFSPVSRSVIRIRQVCRMIHTPIQAVGVRVVDLYGGTSASAARAQSVRRAVRTLAAAGLIDHRDGRVRLVYDALSPKDQEKWRIEWKRDAEAALG
jgi:hypothetical protein